jgi:hypothetical protein
MLRIARFRFYDENSESGVKVGSVSAALTVAGVDLVGKLFKMKELLSHNAVFRVRIRSDLLYELPGSGSGVISYGFGLASGPDPYSDKSYGSETLI